MRKELLFYCLALTLFTSTQTTGQTLTAGDIAIIGFHQDDLDGFTFITLTNIPGNEVIYFTDHSWSYTYNTWHDNNTEAHYSWTAPAGGLSIGTIVTITENYVYI